MKSNFGGLVNFKKKTLPTINLLIRALALNEIIIFKILISALNYFERASHSKFQ